MYFIMLNLTIRFKFKIILNCVYFLGLKKSHLLNNFYIYQNSKKLWF